MTQYLTEDAVRGTLRFLSHAGAGSQLVFTYVREDFLDGRRSFDAENLFRAFVRKDRVWHFGSIRSGSGTCSASTAGV